jgi:hypothetical protein
MKDQMVELENRLRAADRERSMLQNEIHRVKQHSQPNNKFQREIETLNANLAASERKAASLFPYKVANDRLI